MQTSLPALECLAAVAALDGNPLAAARLLGFADVFSAREDYWRSAVEQRAYGILTAAVIRQPSGNVAAALHAQGATLTLEGAIDEALAIGGRPRGAPVLS